MSLAVKHLQHPPLYSIFFRKNAWQQLVSSTAILEMEAAPDKRGSLTPRM